MTPTPAQRRDDRREVRLVHRPAIRSRNHLLRRHPVAAFLVIGISAGWAVMAIPLATGLPAVPVMLAVYLGLCGLALLLTRMSGEPGAVGRLLAGVLRWHLSPTRYTLILLGMPTATLAVATIAGTAAVPGGWWTFVLGYLFQTVVWGALLLNVWEETIWTGFLQSRLMHRHGLLIGSLLTAPAFIAIHLPLSFLPGWTWAGVALNLGQVVIAAPFMRYLLGMHYLDTRGSLAAVGLQHAAFNASAGLGLAGWEYVAGLVILTVLVAAARRRVRRGQL